MTTTYTSREIKSTDFLYTETQDGVDRHTLVLRRLNGTLIEVPVGIGVSGGGGSLGLIYGGNAGSFEDWGAPPSIPANAIILPDGSYLTDANGNYITY